MCDSLLMRYQLRWEKEILFHFEGTTLLASNKSTQRHWISWTEKDCANLFSSTVITHVLSVKWLGHWKLCLQIPRSPQCFWTCCVAAFPVTLLKKEFNSVLCLMRMFVSPNLDRSLWLTTSISLSFLFMFKVYLWLPYYSIILVVFPFFSYYTFDFTSKALKPLPFLPSPKCVNVALRWIDQNCQTYTHLDLHSSSETQWPFSPEKIN